MSPKSCTGQIAWEKPVFFYKRNIAINPVENTKIR